MAWTNSLVFMILLLTQSLVFGYSPNTQYQHGLFYSTWNEKSKADVAGNTYRIKSQINTLDYRFSILKNTAYFDYIYFSRIGFGRANSDSDENFTFKQTGTNVYTVAGGLSIYQLRLDKIKFGLQGEVFNRLIAFKESEPSLKIYQKEKTIFSLGLDLLFNLGEQKKISQQFCFLSEGSLKWSIGLLF